MTKQQWKLLEWYRGFPIEYREGMQRRGFMSIYHNLYNDGKIGCFVHHTAETAKRHIDTIHKHSGDGVQLTEEEYQRYIADE